MEVAFFQSSFAAAIILRTADTPMPGLETELKIIIEQCQSCLPSNSSDTNKCWEKEELGRYTGQTSIFGNEGVSTVPAGRFSAFGTINSPKTGAAHAWLATKESQSTVSGCAVPGSD